MTIRQQLTANIGLKVVSLFLASLLWLFVSAGMEGDMTVTAFLHYRNLSPGLAVENNAPTTVNLKITGPKMLLWFVKNEGFSIPLDLKGVRAGDVTFAHLEKYAEVQRGLWVTRVYPSTLTLHVRKVEKGGQ